jgi:hypothetical protein
MKRGNRVKTIEEATPHIKNIQQIQNMFLLLVSLSEATRYFDNFIEKCSNVLLNRDGSIKTPIMKFVLISDEKRIFEGDVKELSCISENGPFIVMDGHVPYLSKIGETVVFTKIDGSTELHEIKEGFLYTNGDVCFVIVDM